MKRRFLFLQGSASPFFYRLGKRLKVRGVDVMRINFSAGDRLFWNDDAATDFPGTAREWPAYIDEFFKRHAISDLVFFNDCRPLHQAAVAAAEALGITVHVFEEGYLRPNWLTLERGGVNGNSPLPKTPAWYVAQAQDLAELPRTPASGSGMKNRILFDFQWQFATALGGGRYPGFRTHRPYPIWAEYATWAKRLATLWWRKAQARRMVAQLIETKQAYFLFPLQLDSDSQVRVHSPFGTMPAAIEHVIRDFAAHATAQSHLVIKNHPLDNGWINYRAMINRLCGELGLGERVHFIDGGDLHALLLNAQGTVTINSTVGMTAIELGCATLCLGNAVFDIAGLSCQQGLAAFWQTPQRPDPALWQAFRKVLMHTCLINGNFYTDEGINQAIDEAIVRMTASI